MTPDTAQFEEILRSRYRQRWEDVRKELEKYQGQQYADLTERGSDPADEALTDLLVDLNIAEIDRDILELRAIHHAIARIKRGTYGICAQCGSAIDPNRLRALPEAALCVECQARKERRAQAPDFTPSL